MTDLTEQWKKGELPNGMYYIEFKDGDISKDVYAFGSWGNINEHFLKQVLAPVPSYEECLALQSDSLAKNEAVEINAELENSIKDLKHRNENLRLALKTYELPEIQKILTDWRTGELDKKFNKFEKENTQLKELLKECREEIEKHIPKKWHGEKDETMQKYRNKRELRTKIDEVLK